MGGFLTRPPRGALYAGVTLLEGPISNQVLTFSYSYWMSPKWVSSFGINAVLGKTANYVFNGVNNNIGESCGSRGSANRCWSAPASASTRSATPSASFHGRAPRSCPRDSLGQVGGGQIPPAGAFGLE